MECQERFDSFCKKILKNHARNYETQLRRYRSRECFLEDIYKNSAWWKHPSVPSYDGAYIFRVIDMEVTVKDFSLGAALEKLDNTRRDIVLLSYFLEMTDREIGECLNLIRRSVTYRRGSTLKQLKKLLEAYENE